MFNLKLHDFFVCYKDTSALPEDTPLVRFIQIYIQD